MVIKARNNRRGWQSGRLQNSSRRGVKNSNRVIRHRREVKGIDPAYIRAVENIYNREEKDLELMITASKNVGMPKPIDVRRVSSAKRLTQTEIINQLADKSGMKKAQAKEFFNALASLAASEVKKNGEFTLPGFGKLVKATRKAREGRNPATGDVIKIPAKTTVKFRLGKTIEDATRGK